MSATLLASLSPLLPRKNGQPTVQVCSAAALYVPLAEQSSDIAGDLSQPKLVTSQQQVSDARVARQLCHRLTMLGQLPILLKSAKTTQQVGRL
ncbi:hypothetical protein D3C75_703600 [compost metagenome]